MKTLIIYTTSNSCTQKAVGELAQKFSGEVQRIDLKHSHTPSLDEFDRIIIGGSIQSSQIRQRINSFCLTHMHILRKKEIGLFICSSEKPEIARVKIENTFPEELHQLAKTEAIFRGVFNLDEMNLVRRVLVRKLGSMRGNSSTPDFESIERFAMRMEKTYHPFLFLV